MQKAPGDFRLCMIINSWEKMRKLGGALGIIDLFTYYLFLFKNFFFFNLHCNNSRTNRWIRMLLLWKAHRIYLEFWTACRGLLMKFTEILSALVKAKMKINNNEKPDFSLLLSDSGLLPALWKWKFHIILKINAIYE